MKPPVKNIKNDIIKATTLIYIVYNNTLNKPIPRTVFTTDYYSIFYR